MTHENWRNLKPVVREPLKPDPEGDAEFDRMFNEMIDPGYRPDDPNPKEKSE